MLRRFALEQDVARRVTAAKALMEEKGLGAILIPARGAPGMMGMAQYFTNLNLWAGPAWVVLTADDQNRLCLYGHRMVRNGTDKRQQLLGLKILILIPMDVY